MRLFLFLVFLLSVAVLLVNPVDSPPSIFAGYVLLVTVGVFVFDITEETKSHVPTETIYRAPRNKRTTTCKACSGNTNNQIAGRLPQSTLVETDKNVGGMDW